jgi:predicted dehydrogenase
LVASGRLGPLRRVEFEDGAKFDWPLASPSLFGAGAGGRGILLDIGAHVVDLLCWWLDGTPTVTRYADDSLGGTEAFVDLEMAFASTPVAVRLSWLGTLRNRFTLEGERATVSGGIYEWNNLTLREGGRVSSLKLPDAVGGYPDFADALLENFCDVVVRGARPLVSGADVLPSLATIDSCYARRARVEMPWYDAWTRVVSA